MTCRGHVRAATRPARRRGVPYGSPKTGKLLRELAGETCQDYFYEIQSALMPLLLLSNLNPPTAGLQVGFLLLHSSLKIGAKAAASCVTHCLLNKDVYNKERDIVHTILLYICLTPCYNAIM